MRWFERYTLHEWRKEFKKLGLRGEDLQKAVDHRIEKLRHELERVEERANPQFGSQLSLFQMEGYVK